MPVKAESSSVSNDQKKAKRPPTARKRKRVEKAPHPKKAVAKSGDSSGATASAATNAQRQEAQLKTQVKEVVRIIERIRRQDDYMIFDKQTNTRIGDTAVECVISFTEGQVSSARQCHL